MIVSSICRNPERGLCLVLCILCFGIMAMLSGTAASAASQDSGGDAKRGQDLFSKRCSSCHDLDREREGPRLRGVFGRKSASVSTFNYSDALKNANITWDATSLDKWLTDTDKFIPDNDMNLSFRNAQERADIIAFLKQQSGQ